MTSWETEFPPDFPIERIARRAVEEGEARRARRHTRRLALASTSLVVVVIAAATATRSWQSDRGQQVSAGAPAAFGSPAANGKIAFVRSTGPLDPAPKVYVMDPDGSDQTFVRELATVDDLQWSPDGTRLALSHERNIFVVNGDGSDLTQLTADGESMSPTWSPDGKQIAYRSASGE